MEGQNHPLYATDREMVNRLIAIKNPAQEDLIDLARLFMRYDSFPGAKDIQMDKVKILKIWGITREELNKNTRNIWAKGFRPGSSSEEMLGSSFDTSENSTN